MVQIMTHRENVQKTLLTALQGAQVEVLDPREDDCHLEAIVVAEQFEGLSLVHQHRLVMSCLADQFEEGLHALALKTYTPKQWEEHHARAN